MQDTSPTNPPPSISRWEKFITNFIVGGVFGVLGALWHGQQLVSVLVSGIMVGLILGSLGGTFRQESFNFLIAFLSRNVPSRDKCVFASASRSLSCNSD
jgi:hypothetical protein